MSVSLFYTLMMKMKVVGEKNNIVCIQACFCYGLGVHQLSCAGILVVVDRNVFLH